jgi:aspartyl-tRNA(Asn)/glutamyl-tRNA(Gln) amidotransferase subunit A
MSVAGLPAISVPAGFADNLPVGLQLTAPAFHEERLLQVAARFEEAKPQENKSPLF